MEFRLAANKETRTRLSTLVIRCGKPMLVLAAELSGMLVNHRRSLYRLCQSCHASSVSCEWR